MTNQLLKVMNLLLYKKTTDNVSIQ